MEHHFRIPILSKDNYQRWIFDLTAALKSKKVLGVADGTIKMEDQEAAALETWNENDGKAMYLISQSLSDEHHAQIRDCQTSAQMLSRINGWFTTGNIMTKTAAWKDFFGCHFTTDQSVSSYVSSLNQSKQRLESLNVKTCDDDMMIGKLLDELPDRFAHFQSSFTLGLSTGTVKDLKFADIVKHLIQVEEQMEKGADRIRRKHISSIAIRESEVGQVRASCSGIES